MIAYIGLGSNLGDKAAHLQAGISYLDAHPEIRVVRWSSFVTTAPYGVVDQPAFLNGVIEIETSLSAQALLASCLDAEKAEHRQRTQHWGPRTLDCDILLYGEQVIEQPGLVVPHPDMHNRHFVLEPLLELAADVVHPTHKKTIRKLYEELTMKQTAAIILAAGKGTRMKSELPKVVHPLAKKPLIQWVVDTALSIDCSRVICVVGYKKEVVIDTIKADQRVSFVEQKEQNGTGHAVMVTADALADFDGTVFILCGDVPLLTAATLERMREHHLTSGAQCTVLTAFMDDPLRYGRIVRNADGSVQRIVEYKDASEEERAIREINTGIYCFDSKSLFNALNSVTNENNQNEYYLTDTLEILNKEGKLVTSVILEDMVEASGINSQEQLATLEAEYYNRINA